MPVVGVVDPSHHEAMYDIEGRPPHWYTPEELLQHARFRGPKWSSWTYELIAAALADVYEGRTHERVSVTTLLGCPRSVVLERKEEYITSLDSLYSMLRGTMVHRTLECGARPGAIAEGHFLTEIEGVELSCVIDLLTAEGDMFDYKVAKKDPGWYPYRSQTLQLMYNSFIVRHASRFTTNDGKVYGEPKELREGQVFAGSTIDVPDIKSATIVYLLPEWPKVITVEKKQPWITPNGREVERKQPYIWTDEEVLEGEKKGEPGLAERVAAMREALDSYPKFPKHLAKLWGGRPEDGWRCPGKPFCSFPDCLAKRYPNALVWDKPDED